MPPRRRPSRRVRRNRTFAVALTVLVAVVGTLGYVTLRPSPRRTLATKTVMPLSTSRAGTSAATATATTTTAPPPAPTTTSPAPPAGTSPPAGPTATSPTATTPPAPPVATTLHPAAAPGPPVTTRPATASAGVLSGKVVAIDPGHNGDNFTDPTFINHLIWNGRTTETCDTTGTETDGGYTEALFNFDVAQYLAADLRGEGAAVVLTRSTNSGVGPCVDQRAAIGNAAHADAAISIHADGGPPGGRGFAVLEPVSDGVNAAIVAPSAVLGTDVRDAFVRGAGEPTSTYDGSAGIAARDDLGGLNLSTVPKVLVECANMRNATDAALLVTSTWQQQAAQALAQGITTFLAG